MRYKNQNNLDEKIALQINLKGKIFDSRTRSHKIFCLVKRIKYLSVMWDVGSHIDRLTSALFGIQSLSAESIARLNHIFTRKMESKFEDTSFGEEEFQFDNDECIIESSGTLEEIKFDETVGALEDIVVCSDEFGSIQESFFDKHSAKFTDDDENRVEYTAIFEDYTMLMESTLERLLSAKVPDFNMHEFEKQLINRKEDIAGEIFDLLLSFSDFTEFKAQILAYKRAKEGDDKFDGLLVVSSIGAGNDDSMNGDI